MHNMTYLQTSFPQLLNAGHYQDIDGADNTTVFDFQSPPSPSGTSSSSCTDISSAFPPSSPQSIHVVCNAPLVAPIPLPYHSPTFLQFDLPDVDQDLSHPPYTQRTPKRKREVLHEDQNDPIVSKRRSVTSSSYLHPRRRTTRCNTHHPIAQITRPRLHCYT